MIVSGSVAFYVRVRLDSVRQKFILRRGDTSTNYFVRSAVCKFLQYVLGEFFFRFQSTLELAWARGKYILALKRVVKKDYYSGLDS